ncbi:sodium channel and clathrin linker 1 isoform X3 [Canis lupus dingo]|uniref:Sodium channel and clathrin linker 1 n=2 Tax=Canis lupus familiaris TaxID=9615 RepID=A0A8I3PSR4_CANLF|nr:sodium channel and clathrin linker 1 isoform X3 [Canis lupus dingo]|eukprot:XP_005631859.1 sodium channel and clathrin linker 1 isoform X3 [Canis lupus familiaris]
MATEIDFLRDQNQRLNEVLRRYQMEDFSKYSLVQEAVFKGDGDDTLKNTVVDRSFLAPLIIEYDKHLEELNGQLKYYKKQMGEMKLQFENVIKENERLHSELKDAIEKQLETFPFGTDMGSDIYTDDETVRNLQEQLQLANQEKTQAVELWQTVSQELGRLQRLYQEHMTEAQIHVVESQKQKDQLTNFQQLTKQLHVTKENIEMTNQHFLETVTEQNVEIEQLRKQLRLCVAIQEATQLRAQKTHLEKRTRELQAKCNELENEKYEAIVRARNSMQLLEEANLQKNQAVLQEKQKEEDVEKMKETVSRLVQDAAMITRKEVANTRKQYSVQISRLTEELSALQMECAEKQSQIERAIREKKAVEEELEKIYHEGKVNESDYRKLEEMHQRCLVAERCKDDLQLRLKTAENKIKQLEINSSEEISRCQEMIRKLQDILESERENCGFVSEQRLKLQQENEQLQKETEDLRKIALEAQKKAKLKISTMEHEFSIKEHGFEVQLREMEDSNRNSTVELRHLLVTQQKAANRWKEETKKLTESAEIRISSLKSELSRQKLHTQELLSQLEMANEKVVENEKLILEHQEKANRLQRRLSQAEQRAASASQQLSVITVQRRKAASMMNLENI